MIQNPYPIGTEISDLIGVCRTMTKPNEVGLFHQISNNLTIPNPITALKKVFRGTLMYVAQTSGQPNLTLSLLPALCSNAQSKIKTQLVHFSHGCAVVGPILAQLAAMHF